MRAFAEVRAEGGHGVKAENMGFPSCRFACVKGAKLEFVFQDMTKLHVAMTRDVGADKESNRCGN